MTNGEYQVLTRCVLALQEAGFSLVRAYDGEQRLARRNPKTGGLRPLDQLIEWSAQCDEGSLHFAKLTPEGEAVMPPVTGMLWLVYGNARDGSEIVADHSVGAEFDNAVMAWMEGEIARDFRDPSVYEQRADVFVGEA